VGPTRSQPRFGWLESITLSYEHEDYTVGSDDGITDLFIGGVTYRLKRADDDIAPTRGHRFDIGLRGADEALLSSQTFVSLRRRRAVRTLTGRVRLVAASTAGVTTRPFASAAHDPLLAGGDNSAATTTSRWGLWTRAAG
jgi:translocation and assembly module TamA